MQAKNMATDC